MTEAELRAVEVHIAEDGTLVLMSPDGSGHWIAVNRDLPEPDYAEAAAAFAAALGDPPPLMERVEKVFAGSPGD